MTIVLNRHEQSTASSNISELLAEFSISERGIAIGLNERVIPRAEWGSTPLSEGDTVVVVSAVFGG